jgi:hypothetical protein
MADYQQTDGPTQPVDLEQQEQLKKAEGELLDAVTRDFQRLQQQKNRKTGGVEARVLQTIAFEWGEHYISQNPNGLAIEPHEPNKLYLRFNVIAPAVAKLSGRLTSLGMQFYARPDKKDPKAQADAEVIDKLILALDEKVDQNSRTWELVDWILKGGTAFEYVPWIPNQSIEPVPQFSESNELMFTDLSTNEAVPESVRDQAIQSGTPPEQFEVLEEIEPVGDVGSEILGPLNVFIDQSVRSVQDLAPDQAIYIAKIRTKGWVEETYGDVVDLSECEPDRDLKIVTTTLSHTGESSASLFIKDMIPTVQGELGPDDPPMYVVVERFLPNSKTNPKGRYTVFIPSKKILFDGDNPYEEVPIVDFHFKPVTTTFWTKDFITDLIPPQKFINKRISQMGEQANASIYDILLLGSNLTTDDVPADKPGVVEKGISENGQPLVQRVPGPQLPGWFLESINMVMKLYQQIAGGSDLFEEHHGTGQMRGPMAVPMLQELLDSEWGMLYQHFGERMARVKQMRINRVKQFYPPIRTMHYTDSDQRDEVMTFHTDKVLRSGHNYNVTVERGSLLPELRALREARVRERLESPLSILYTDDRTGRLDKSKIAADLHMGDFGREGKESNSRKFSQQLIEKLWQGQQVPPVMQFWDHEPMLDELEAAMMTTEFLSASPPIQQLFMDRWNQHSQFLQARQQAQQQASMTGMMHAAVANATQQTAAKVAAEVTDQSLAQVHAQIGAAQQNNPANQIRAQMQFGPGGGNGNAVQPPTGGSNGPTNQSR